LASPAGDEADGLCCGAHGLCAQMMKLTDNQLEMTTKRTIMENEQMSVELSYQSRQTEKLLNKNSK
jgi:hypothetical protein